MDCLASDVTQVVVCGGFFQKQGGDGSTFTDCFVVHTNGSLVALYIPNNVLYTESGGSTEYMRL